MSRQLLEALPSQIHPLRNLQHRSPARNRNILLLRCDPPVPFPPSQRQREILEYGLRIVLGPIQREAHSRSSWTRAWTQSRASGRSRTPSRSAPRAPLLPPGQPVKDVLNIQSRIWKIRNYFSIMERHQQTLWLNPGSRILASTRRKRKDKNKEKLQSIDKTIR